MKRSDIAACLRAAATRVELGDDEGALLRLQRARRMIKRQRCPDDASLMDQLRASINMERIENKKTD